MIKFNKSIYLLFVFISFFFLCLFSCWKKQDHNIVIPETPVYDFSGIVRCSLTNEPIRDLYVTIEGVVKYNENDSTENLVLIQTTDENGMFRFPDIPGGYQYLVKIELENYAAFSERYSLLYSDMYIEDIILSRLLILHDECFYENCVISSRGDLKEE